MPTYYARKGGNINAADVWATTPSGTASNLFPTFTSADVLMANSFGITVNVDTAVGEVRNDTFSGATGGGNFTLSNGVTLTSNVICGNVQTQTIAFSAATGAIVGNIQAGNPGGNWHAVNNSGSGILTITGNIVAGGSASSHGVGNTSTGTTTIIGNVTGGAAASSVGVRNSGTGIVNITGIVTGGSNATAFGCDNASTGQINITGTSVGGLNGVGASNSSTATVNITRVKGNAYGPGNSSGLTAVVGAANTGLGVIQIEELEYGTFGQSPTSGTGIRLKKASSNVAVFNYCDTAGAKTLIDATQNAAMPAATDVRNGVSYASGSLTGSAFIPLASSVASGVPVDATTGTAVLTAAAIRAELAVELGRIDAAVSSAGNAPTAVQIRTEMDANSTKLANLDAAVSSRLAPSGTLATVTTLTNAPTVPTAAAIATQVRSELATELARVDAAVSTRLASSAYSAAPTTAQIATAVEGSLLNEADGQAVLNAIVGAIGNTNLSEVSIVAAVRADLERVGGKIDSIPAAPTAAANATAVWATASKTITGGTVDTLTNSPSVPSAASIASATRTELAVELARVDVATSTRLAGSAYTAPANSDVTAIKAKTDLLNTDRLANVATTAIVGNLIAQANS